MRINGKHPGGRPRKIRWCEWCGDELPYSARPKRLCDKETCHSEWWADLQVRKSATFKRRREERLRHGNVKICPRCDAPVFDKDHVYCTRACWEADLKDQAQARRQEIRALSHLPVKVIMTRLGIGEYAVRYRLKVANEQRKKGWGPKPELRKKVVALRSEGLSQGQIAKYLAVTNSTVSGQLHRERRAQERRHEAA